MLRKLLIGLAAVIVVVAGGLYFVYSNLDSLIKTAVETYGSQATQAEVRLDKVNLSPTTGEGGLVGLRVGNPKGFATPEALRLGEVRMTVDVSTLASSPVIVREIVIVKPQVTYERGPGGSNLEALQKSAAAYAGIGQRGAASGEKQEAGQGPKIIIENLYVRDGQIGIGHTALKGRTLSAGLPAIHLKDIGKDNGGASPAEVIDKVMASIGGAAAKVAGADLDKALGTLRDTAAGAIKDAVKDAAPGATDQLQRLFKQ